MNRTLSIKDPIPTQYRGVVFKSKSEAIFARALDLAGCLWEYEPEHSKAGDYLFDFFVAFQYGEHVSTALIEYKPDVPNKTYLARLANIAMESGFGKPPHYIVVACGSPWNLIRKTFIYHSSAMMFVENPTPVFVEYVNQASKYRFDINH